MKNCKELIGREVVRMDLFPKRLNLNFFTGDFNAGKLL